MRNEITIIECTNRKGKIVLKRCRSVKKRHSSGGTRDILQIVIETGVRCPMVIVGGWSNTTGLKEDYDGL